MFLAFCLFVQLNLQCVHIKHLQSTDKWCIPIALAGSLPFLYLCPSENCRGCLFRLSGSKLRLNADLSGDKIVMVIIFLTLYMIAYHLYSLKLHIMENLLVIQSFVGCSEENADKIDDKCTDNQIVETCFLFFPLYKRIMFRDVWNYQFLLFMHSL